MGQCRAVDVLHNLRQWSKRAVQVEGKKKRGGAGEGKMTEVERTEGRKEAYGVTSIWEEEEDEKEERRKG